jgi:MYXO-CTERM domain-containing protein
MLRRMRKLTLPLVVAAGLLAAAPASAFCGFYVAEANQPLYNNATQVALVRDGTRTVLSMQNAYEGPPERFAMVVPVPVVLQKENVKTLPRDLFAKLDTLDAPRLVEYWEQDPCEQPPDEEADLRAAPQALRGQGNVWADALDHGVKVEAQFAVGEYEIVILSAKDSGGLDTWLKEQKYAIPDGAEPFLRPYVTAGSKFFVAKVDPKKVTFDEHHQAMLSPLRFHYDAETFSLPVRLGLLNAKGKQDLIVHLLAIGKRYELANYKNVTIPTNLDVTETTRQDFAGFYASLFDATLAKNPGAIVTEYAWDAGSCDPCPGPALSAQDVATLGGDVLTHQAAPSQFTLTRLHARYGRETLGEDLVFRAAPAIAGGREWTSGANGKLEVGAQPSSYNNFQGRYAIRHPWTGPITCDHPVRSRWGGPPTPDPSKNATVAKGTAFAKRDLALASYVTGDVPELDLKSGSSIAPVASGAPSATPPSGKPAAKGGCGSCSTTSSSSGLGEGSILGVVALAVFRRLRRQRAK